MSKELKLNLNIACLFVQCIALGHLIFDIRTCNLQTDNNTADDANVLVKNHEKLRRSFQIVSELLHEDKCCQALPYK